MLKEAALRLLSVARDSDTVARVGGDELVLLMEDVVSPADCVSWHADWWKRPFDIAPAGADFWLGGHRGLPDHGRGRSWWPTPTPPCTQQSGQEVVLRIFEPHMDIGALEGSIYRTTFDMRLRSANSSCTTNPRWVGVTAPAAWSIVALEPSRARNDPARRFIPLPSVSV